MPRRPANPWLSVGLNAWSLGAEASAVIGLRMAKLAVGGAAAEIEPERMVAEKLEAALALQAMDLTGGLGITSHGAAAKAIAQYRRKVRANLRRLQKA